VWGDFLVKENVLILLEFFMLRKGLVKLSKQDPHDSFAKRGSFVYKAEFSCLLTLSLFDFEEINNEKKKNLDNVLKSVHVSFKNKTH